MVVRHLGRLQNTTAGVRGTIEYPSRNFQSGRTGYRGLQTLEPDHVILKEGDSSAACLDHLRNGGYRLVEFQNDGRTTLLFDSGGTCIGVIVPPGQDLAAIQHIGARLHSLQHLTHKVAGDSRGDFKIIRHGLQMGQGSKSLGPCAYPALRVRCAAEDFFQDTEVKTLLQRAGAAFRTYFPNLHRYYRTTVDMASAFTLDSDLPCESLPFASFTLNVGDRCVTKSHVDRGNLACGLCLASPFGNFDYTKGGHLVLHGLKLVLEVPAGSIVLFPSATITHENVPIQPGELRQSITGYTAGSVFQWCDLGFKSAGSVVLPRSKRRHGVPRITKLSQIAARRTIWRTMVSRLPHIRRWL